jgi:hypothetical protein
MEQYGHGPWHVALLQDHKGTTTKIVTHTHISLLVDAMYEVSKHKERWVPLLEVGPFSRLADAQAFADEWTRGARGVESRLMFGEGLYLRERDRFHLRMAIQSVSVDTFAKNHKWSGNSTAITALVPPPPLVMMMTSNAKSVQLIEKNRTK